MSNAGYVPQKDLIKRGADLGETGALLILTIILSPIGAILWLIALRRLSKAYGSKTIWRNTLIAIIANVFAFLFGSIASAVPVSIGVPVIIAMILASYAFTLLSGWLMRSVFNELRTLSNIEEFGKTAKWFWLGAILSIVIVGIILIWVGYYHARRGFKKLANQQ